MATDPERVRPEVSGNSLAEFDDSRAGRLEVLEARDLAGVAIGGPGQCVDRETLKVRRD
jgi:hypothetical protein